MSEQIYNDTNAKMDKTVSHYQSEIGSIRTGRATTHPTLNRPRRTSNWSLGSTTETSSRHGAEASYRGTSASILSGDEPLRISW